MIEYYSEIEVNKSSALLNNPLGLMAYVGMEYQCLIQILSEFVSVENLPK